MTAKDKKYLTALDATEWRGVWSICAALGMSRLASANVRKVLSRLSEAGLAEALPGGPGGSAQFRRTAQGTAALGESS